MFSSKTTSKQTPFISFSARGLLLHDSPPFEKWLFPYLQSLGVRWGQDEFRQKVLEALRALPEEVSGHKGRLVESEFLIRSIFQKADIQNIEAALDHHRSMTRVVIVREMFDWMEALRNRGYRLAVLSNEGAELVEVLRFHQLLDFFEFVLTADDVESPKPYKNIFEQALEEFGAKPDQMVHVGDRYFFDIEGAASAGLSAILYDPLKVEREAYGPVVQQKIAQDKSTQGKIVSLAVRKAEKSLENVRVIEKFGQIIEIFQ